jgi:hypothetical protein
VDRDREVALWSSRVERIKPAVARLIEAKEESVSSSKSSEPVETYLMEPGKGRPSFDPGVLEYLPSDAPLPEVGDVILLPRSSTGDTREQAFGWAGTVTPFRVVEREHLYFRGDADTRDRLNPSPARYLKTLVLVRRLTAEEYYAEPGQVIVPADAMVSDPCEAGYSA